MMLTAAVFTVCLSSVVMVGQAQTDKICKGLHGDHCKSGWRFACDTCSGGGNQSPMPCSCRCDFAAHGSCSSALPAPLPPPCTKPEPLISGSKYNISDASLTAFSTYYTSELLVYAPPNSRLDRCPDNSDWSCAWSPAAKRTGDYIQADLGRKFEIHEVAIQGRADNAYRVTEFSLAFSEDGDSFITLDNNGQNYEGAQDSTTPRKHEIGPIVARYVRMTIKNYYSWPGLRWEVYGCPRE